MSRLVPITCFHCGAEKLKPASAVNRAIKDGASLYCDRICFGLSHRNANPPTEAERKEAKRLYDAQRRIEKADEIKEKKRAYFKRTYDPVKAAAERKAKMPRHLEYCRRPEYRKWKADYDRRYRAINDFGDYADAALVLCQVQAEIDERATRQEIYQANGTVNKSLTRRRSLWQTK